MEHENTASLAATGLPSACPTCGWEPVEGAGSALAVVPCWLETWAMMISRATHRPPIASSGGCTESRRRSFSARSSCLGSSLRSCCSRVAVG